MNKPPNFEVKLHFKTEFPIFACYFRC